MFVFALRERERNLQVGEAEPEKKDKTLASFTLSSLFLSIGSQLNFFFSHLCISPFSLFAAMKNLSS